MQLSLKLLYFIHLAYLLHHTLSIGFFGIPGRYCQVRTPTCCENRNDECTVSILEDHLCYCDMFCDRIDGNDCCPDFQETCEAKSSKTGCHYNGIFYREHETMQQNCKNCTCTIDRWQCDSTICMIEEDKLYQVRAGRYKWTPRNYSYFWGRSLEYGIRYRLGTLFPEKSVQSMNEMLIRPKELPLRFDARENWPLYIHDIRDQGDCASSWAMSTTATSADRLAIITEGEIDVDLSAQHLLSCNQYPQRGCEGGHLDRAWWYIRKLGVVSENCYPYQSGSTSHPGDCHIKKFADRFNSLLFCPNTSSQAVLYKMTPAYRVSNREKDIMSEIITNGPVQATFLVHADFFMYSSGVYQKLNSKKHDKLQGKSEGYHSVRLIGWDEDNTTGILQKFWIAANSWGRDWGEDGYFRILRGENHCEIESFVIGSWGKVDRRLKFYR